MLDTGCSLHPYPQQQQQQQQHPPPNPPSPNGGNPPNGGYTPGKNCRFSRMDRPQRDRLRNLLLQPQARFTRSSLNKMHFSEWSIPQFALHHTDLAAISMLGVFGSLLFVRPLLADNDLYDGALRASLACAGVAVVTATSVHSKAVMTRTWTVCIA